MSPIDPLAADKASGIPPALLQHIHRALIASPYFETHASLRALFSDARINAWHDQLPQVEQLTTRAWQVIDLLHPAHDAEGENALRLLLLVLADRTPHGQELHTHFKTLARRLIQPWGSLSREVGSAIKEPYLGLRAFQVEDAPLFFGREALITKLLAKVEGSTFLAVLGPSGSGKSSAVLAGLLPALHTGGKPSDKPWSYLVLKPGPRPLDRLASDLLYQFPEAPLPDGMTLIQMLGSDEKALLRVVGLLRTRLLLVVDQFEELWTQASGEPAQQQAFIRLLLAAVAAPDTPLLVILTLRADFLHLAANYPELAEWIEKCLVLVSPMQADDLREAIEQPATLAGGHFEPRLVERLIEEVEGKAGALPLLEYTLRELWNRRDPDDNTMTWATFEALGGVEGALAARADEIVGRYYTKETREELRHLLLRLVQPGEGVEDTSRRLPLAELVPEGGSLAAVQLLLQPLIDERLLTSNRDPESEPESIEVSHEALIRSWGTFRGWIDEARGDLRQQLQVEQAAREWQGNAHDPAFLWSGLRLDIAEAWLVRARPRLSKRDQHFLHACRAQKEALEVTASAQAAKEEANHQERERLLNATQRNLRVVAMLLILALLMAGVAWNSQRLESEARQVADQEKDRAEQATQLEAEARELAEHQADLARREGTAGEALFELSQNNQDLALLLTLGAIHDTDDRSLLTSRALRTTLEETQIKHRLEGHAAAVNVAVWSPDGMHILTGSNDGTGHLWDTRTGQLVHTLQEHGGAIYAVAWSPDGTQLLTGSQDDTARLWEARTGQLIHTLSGHTDSVNAVAWSPDGTQLLTGSDDGTARLWKANSGQLVHILKGHTGPVYTVAWSPDGTQFLTGSGDITARLWEARTGQLIHVLEGRTGSVRTVAWSPDGTQFLTGGDDGTTRLWEARTGQPIHLLSGHTGAIWTVAWSPDGTQFLTGSLDGTARLWEARTGQPVHILKGHTGPVYTVAWSPDGTQFLTGGNDGTARLWAVHIGQLVHTLEGHTGPVYVVDWSPDGTQFLTGSYDSTARLWEARTSQLIHTFQGHTDLVYRAMWSPDGTQVLTGSYDSTARLWEARTGQLVHVLEGHKGPVYAVDWSPDGTQVLTGSHDGTARLWEARTGQLIHVLEGHDDWVATVAWSPDGTQFFTGSYNGSARLWEARTGQLIHVLEGHTGWVNAVAWSPDGTQLLTGSADGTARLWESHTGQLVHTLTESNWVTVVAWSPDGTQFLTGREDGTSRLWEAHTGQLIHTLSGHTAMVRAVAWSPDGTQLLTGSYDGTARLWEAHTGELIHTFSGHTGAIWSVAWSPDGAQFLTGSDDGTARIWIPNEDILVARLTERVCHIRTDEEIKARIAAWQGCDAELAAVADDLAAYHALRGE